MRHRVILIAAVLLVLTTVPALATLTIPGFDETSAASGLTFPTGIAFLPDGRFLVTEEGGGVWVVDSGTATLLTTIPVPPFPCIDYETGLLGIAVDPNFTTNGYVYFYRTNDHGNACNYPPDNWTNEVVRVTVGPGDTVDLGSLTVLLEGIRCDSGYHVGGGLRIGPDGKLYIGIGEQGNGDFLGGGPGTSTNIYAQDLGALEGKLLRINIPDGSIPSDNPYANQAGKRGEIWASGLRNPWRFGFDPVTGKLWLGDVGEEDNEEIDVVTKGADFSWPHCEGNEPSGCREQGEIAPIFTYPHTGSDSAIMGGGFAGCSFGSLAGYYFYGDVDLSTLSMIQPNASHDGVVGSAATFVTGAGGPVDVVFGPDGALYYTAIYAGEVRRISPSTAGGQPVTAKKLILKDSATDSSKKALQILSQDPLISLCGSDPTIDGATIAVAGPGWGDVYTLPASGWTKIVKSGNTKGYNYKDPDLLNGPIHVAQLKDGKLKILGKGSGLGHVVGETAPDDVDARFVMGSKQYCMEFGGTPKFTAFKLFKAANAPAPPSCFVK